MRKDVLKNVSIGHGSSRFQLSKQRHNSRTEKVVNFVIVIGLPFMVPDLVYKFQLFAYGELKLLSGNLIWDGHLDKPMYIGKT